MGRRGPTQGRRRRTTQGDQHRRGPPCRIHRLHCRRDRRPAGHRPRDVLPQPRARPGVRRIIDEARASGRATLRRLQWQRANGGSDTMLIWLGKQMLGQKDKVETEATNTHHVSGAFVLGKGDPAEIAQAYRRIIDGTLDDES